MIRIPEYLEKRHRDAAAVMLDGQGGRAATALPSSIGPAVSETPSVGSAGMDSAASGASMGTEA